MTTLAGMKWQLKRSMSDMEFRRTIEQLGMSRAGMARYLGISNSTAYRYAEQGREIPVAISLLLNMILEMDITPVVPPWKRKT